jgi:hypothetical protein
MIEQEIPLGDCRGLTSEDQMAGKATGGCGGGRLSAMVGLRRPPCNQGVAAMHQSVPYQEFEFSNLVATQRQAGLIVSFHEDTRTGESFGQARELHERCWEETQRVSW